VEEDYNIVEGVASGDPYSLLTFGEFENRDWVDDFAERPTPVKTQEGGTSIFLVVLFVLWILGSLAG
jgi:hypothetical protein